MMEVKGKIVEKYFGNSGTIAKIGSIITLIGIVGTIFFIYCIPIAAHDEEAEVIFITMSILGVLDIIIGLILCVKFSRSNYKKTYVEIRTDGIIVFPITKKVISIPYEYLKEPQVNGTDVVLSNTFNASANLTVEDSNVATNICLKIQEVKAQYEKQKQI